MEVKIIHTDNEWKIYPLETNDFFLESFNIFFEMKLYVKQNFHIIKKNECQMPNCKDCKFI